MTNDSIWLEIKCERKHVRLFWKSLAHFMINHAKDVLGAKLAYITFKKKRTTHVDINKNHRQKRIHCKYMKSNTLQELRGIETCASKQSLDSRIDNKPVHKFTSLLQELRACAFMSQTPRILEPQFSSQCLMECMPALMAP